VTGPATAANETYRATIAWDANRDDLRAHTITLADQTVGGSSAPERGGDPAKADPEQLLVAAASACHMLWFLDFSRRERLRVLSYEDEAECVLDERRFVRVVLRPAIEFETEPEPEVLSRLHERAHEACYIANSLNCPVVMEGRAGGAAEVGRP
jgi:organic hydroperoxide reductase OsmC/OhrA